MEVKNYNGGVFLEVGNISKKAEDKFPIHGKVCILRLIGKKEGWYSRFKTLKIGNKTITEADVMSYMNPSAAYAYRVQDYLITADFKKGDEFVFEHDDVIETVQLFLTDDNK